MSQLAVNIGPLPRVLTLNHIEVPCTLTEQLRFAGYVGARVLLVCHLGQDKTLFRYATATLDGFASRDGAIVAILTDLAVLPAQVEFGNFPAGSVFSVVAEAKDLFPIVDSTPLSGGDDAPVPFIGLEMYGQVGQQVRHTAYDLCSFSGVTVALGEGTATPIQPVDAGGTIHVRNVIFLHDEPAQLFNRFAWTIGPDFEIIADAWAMGTSVLSTVNSTGKLLVGEDQRNWPDEAALAWHRQKFFDRLR